MKDFWARLVDSSDRRVEAHLVLLCLGVAAFVALAVYHTVVLKRVFDPESYGQGLGALLAGGGAASWGQGLQRKAEGGDDAPQ
ncbi:MAG: hypothetical protein KGI97_03475 [Alphaproteobacteria bacterium]|nr:hypothetical protein [Alphaproteobacteria bacterium]